MAKSDMREACHLLAEYIMRAPFKGNRFLWLKQEIIDILLNESNSDELETDYSAEYEYADVANPYLADVLKSYDNHEENL